MENNHAESNWRSQFLFSSRSAKAIILSVQTSLDFISQFKSMFQRKSSWQPYHFWILIQGNKDKQMRPFPTDDAEAQMRWGPMTLSIFRGAHLGLLSKKLPSGAGGGGARIFQLSSHLATQSFCPLGQCTILGFWTMKGMLFFCKRGEHFEKKQGHLQILKVG